MNLATTDVERFQSGGTFVNYLWEAPLETLVILYFGIASAGVSFLAGFAALALLVPMQVSAAKTIHCFLCPAAVLLSLPWKGYKARKRRPRRPQNPDFGDYLPRCNIPVGDGVYLTAVEKKFDPKSYHWVWYSAGGGYTAYPPVITTAEVSVMLGGVITGCVVVAKACGAFVGHNKTKMFSELW